MTLAAEYHVYTPKKTPGSRRIDNVKERKGPLKKQHPYYDYGPLLSHNGFYNFLVGGRGLGKTYGAKKRAIDRYIKHKEMWIYLRRYKEELIPVRETLFADIEHAFPKWDFRIDGSILQISPASTRDDRRRNWETMGYIIALSVSQNFKSASYPDVTSIIFDEFIIEKGVVQYLHNEAVKFNNFYSTVDRWQDKTKVFFLANSVSLTNPYFVEYGITPEPDSPEFLKYKDGYIVVHLPHDKAFAESVSQTRFGKFIADTEYEKYAVGNEFADGHMTLVGLKNPKSRYQFTLETRLGKFSVWEDLLAAEYYASRKNVGNPLEFTLIPENVSEDKSLIMYNDDIVVTLRNVYSTGKITFDGPATRNIFLDLFRRQ